jgi:hypothetical protein
MLAPPDFGDVIRWEDPDTVWEDARFMTLSVSPDRRDYPISAICIRGTTNATTLPGHVIWFPQGQVVLVEEDE